MASRILVVDDSATIRHVLRTLLAPMGAEVVDAADGRAALAAATVSPPALVLSDLNMPELDGRGLIAALKKAEGTRAVPVLLMTTATEKASLEKAVLAQVAGVLLKPFDAASVAAAVKPFLGGKGPGR